MDGSRDNSTAAVYQPIKRNNLNEQRKTRGLLWCSHGVLERSVAMCAQRSTADQMEDNLGIKDTGKSSLYPWLNIP